MTILCDQQFEVATSVAASLGERVHRVDRVPAAGAALVADPTENVVVLGAGVELVDACAFATQLRADHPLVGVILLRDILEVEVLTVAIRAGVREVVLASDGTAIKEAVHRSRRLSDQIRQQVHAEIKEQVPAPVALPQFAPKGEIIVVFSAKGGTGKTTVSTNLAVALSASGEHKVCLVDLSLAFGDVGITLQQHPNRTVVDALAFGEQLDSAKVGSIVTHYTPGLDCILAPIAPGDADRVPPALIAQILTILTEMYDYIVIDTPPQFSEHVLVAFDAAHHHILITTPEVPALKNLRLTLDMLDLLSYETATRHILLNRADADVGKGAVDVERVAKGPIAVHVPSSRDVPASINRGKPLTAEQPEHPVSRAIFAFAELNIVGKSAVVASHRQASFSLRRKRRAS